MANNRLAVAFVRSAIFVFFAVGLLKLISAEGNVPILNQYDPLFGVTTRTVLRGVGVAEIIVAGLLMYLPTLRLRLNLILWMGINFLLYRLSLWYLGGGSTCPCLGTIHDALHLNQSVVSWGLMGLVVYFIMGATIFQVDGLRKVLLRIFPMRNVSMFLLLLLVVGSGCQHTRQSGLTYKTIYLTAGDPDPRLNTFSGEGWRVVGFSAVIASNGERICYYLLARPSDD